MSDDLDSLLSAYLDDELPEDRRRSFAGAASEPEKAEELRTLGKVRDLVAGLSRPVPPDLAPAVLGKLAGPARRSGLPRGFRLAAAAGILVAFAGLWASPALRRAERAPGLVPVEPSPLQVPEAAQTPEPLVASNELGDPAGPPLTLAATGSSAPLLDAPGPPRSAVDPEARLRTVAGGLIGRSGPRRLFLVTEAGPDDASQVASILSLSSHRDFYRLESADPSEPVVLAAELDPDELATLRRRLAASYPGRVGEADAGQPSPADLAALGREERLRGEPAAEVHFPDGGLAIRTPFRATETGTEPADESGPPSDAVAAELAGPPAPPKPSAPEGPSVVLIRLAAPTPE